MIMTASRHSGAASGARHSGRSSEAATAAKVTGISAYQLVTHARRYGIERMRESAAIVTAAILANKLHSTVTARTLLSTSERDYKITRDELNMLRQAAEAGDLDNFNRVIDAYEALQRRRHGWDWKERRPHHG